MVSLSPSLSPPGETMSHVCIAESDDYAEVSAAEAHNGMS